MFNYSALFSPSSASNEEVLSRLELVGRGFTTYSRFSSFHLTGAQITTLAAEGRSKKLASVKGTDLEKAAYQDFLIMARALLKLLVNFVNSVATGNRTAVIESGFKCSSPSTRGVRVKHKAKGSTYAGAIDIFYKPHARCGGVSHQVCYDPPTEEAYLNQRMSDPGNYTWTGLISGKKVWTRSCYAIAGGQSEWSDPIPVYVP